MLYINPHSDTYSRISILDLSAGTFIYLFIGRSGYLMALSSDTLAVMTIISYV